MLTWGLLCDLILCTIGTEGHVGLYLVAAQLRFMKDTAIICHCYESILSCIISFSPSSSRELWGNLLYTCFTLAGVL